MNLASILFIASLALGQVPVQVHRPYEFVDSATHLRLHLPAGQTVVYRFVDEQTIQDQAPKAPVIHSKMTSWLRLRGKAGKRERDHPDVPVRTDPNGTGRIGYEGSVRFGRTSSDARRRSLLPIGRFPEFPLLLRSKPTERFSMSIPRVRKILLRRIISPARGILDDCSLSYALGFPRTN